MLDVALIMHAWVIYYFNIPSVKLKTTVKQNWRYQDCNWEKTPSIKWFLFTEKISTYIARHEDTANEVNKKSVRGIICNRYVSTTRNNDS